jgi:Transcriptional regulator
MQPIVEPRATSGLGHRLAITALVGVSVVSVTVVALLAIYVDRISDVASGLRRADALADYPGRPAAVQLADNPTLNFLIFVDTGTQLQAAVIANLSGSRRDLTLVALPADLVEPSGGASLATAYAADPLQATRLVEQVTGARMDHQLQLELTGFTHVVDGLDGLEVDQRRLSGLASLSYLADASTESDRSERAAQLIQQSMIRAEADGGVFNLPRFDKVVSALGGCLTVDTGLSNDAIQAVLVESRVHLEDVELWPLSGVRTSAGTRVSPADLAVLRAGLAADALAETGRLSMGVSRVGSGVRSQAVSASASAEPAATVTSAAPVQAPAPESSASVADDSPSPTVTASVEVTTPTASTQTSR